MNDLQKPGFRPRLSELPGDLEPDAVLAQLCAGGAERPVLLHSAGGRPARFSLLGFAPREVLEIRGESSAAWERLGQVLAGFGAASAFEIPGPFHGGFMGALAYDLHAPGARLDMPAELQPEGFDQPLIVGGVYTNFLVWDHHQKSCHLVLDADGGSQERMDFVRTALAAPLAAVAPPGGSFRRATSSAEHMQGVESVRQAIKAGELYQANLSHQLVGRIPGTAHAAYRSLIAANPVPYGGYVGWPGGALLSASPELLFACDPAGTQARRAHTRPIKGTAPRSSDPVEDEALGRALVASAKDRAELAMIVDLERNDLGRVARSVRVDAMARLERYASVQHLVSDVSAELLPDTSPMDLLAALFPGGSITGAPKLRSMELIAEGEGAGRGFFTGSLGFIDFRGAACFNILIRSLLWNGGDVSLRVGGGVTWASDPGEEDAETLHKAASLLAGLGVKLQG